MQSIDDPALAFLVCEPGPFFPEYEIELEAKDQSLLGLTDEGDALDPPAEDGDRFFVFAPSIGGTCCSASQ